MPAPEDPHLYPANEWIKTTGQPDSDSRPDEVLLEMKCEPIKQNNKFKFPYQHFPYGQRVKYDSEHLLVSSQS